MAADVSRAVGHYAEKVENRSLLLEKFPIHKNYGFDGRKFHDASRHSLLRIADGGSSMLADDAKEKRWRAGGRNTRQDKKEALEKEAVQAEALAKTRCHSPRLLELRAKQAVCIRDSVLKSFGSNGVAISAKLEGRLAINLAEGLIENAGICLDRLFGLPYVPGSAVKGVARHAALWAVRELPDEEREDALLLFARAFGFGTVEIRHDRSDLAWALDDRRDRGRFDSFVNRLKEATNAKDNAAQGGVSFFPAYPETSDAKIVVDLTNVHYPHYYRSGQLHDLKKESPRPNSFPVVESGTVFSFLAVLNGTGARSGQGEAVLALAQRSLSEALTKGGVGAKTGAGYGWFSIVKKAD